MTQCKTMGRGGSHRSVCSITTQLLLGSQSWGNFKTKVKSRTNCQVKICLDGNQIMSSKYLKSLTESQALSLCLVIRPGTVKQPGLLLDLLAMNISELNAKIYELTRFILIILLQQKIFKLKVQFQLYGTWNELTLQPIFLTIKVQKI